jgi:flagellar capping protein FliD
MDREWTDKRIDDFSDRVGRFEANVDKRFDKVDERFDRFEADVDRRFDKVDGRFDRVESKLDTMNRTIWGGIIVAVVVKFLFG